jgi:hypothetical protein
MKPQMENRLDSASTYFLTQQLQSLDPTDYYELVPGRLARRFCPLIGNVAPYDETYKYALTRLKGRAKVSGPKSKAAPTALPVREERVSPIVAVDGSFGWSFDSIRAAQQKNINLDNDCYLADLTASEQTVDSMICYGNGDAVTLGTIPGLINNNVTNGGDITNVAPAAKTGGGDWLAAATPMEEILKDVVAMIQDVKNGLKQAMAANTRAPMFETFSLFLPTALFHHLALPRSTQSDMSVLRWLKANLQDHGLTAIEPWWQLDAAAPGASAGKGMALLAPNVESGAIHPLAGGALVPLEHTREQEQYAGRNVVVPTVTRCGGFINRFPIAFRTMFGAAFDA